VSILIAGCGYVGTALAQRLARQGERVLGLRRDRSALPEGILGIAADLRDRAALERALPPTIDRVVYAVAPDGPDEPAYHGAYVEQLASLLDALDAVGARLRRVVLTTSTAVYSQEDGGWVDENSPAEAGGRAARMLEGEALLRARCGDAGVVLRLAGIYGPGRDQMIRMVREGRARRPRAPRWTNRIHRDDAASAIAHLLALAEPAPIYVGVDDEPADLGEVYAWIARELGLPEPPLEDGPQRARGGHKRCKNARLRESGWAPSYPSFREGYRALLRPSGLV
jgi:nucleoside-diphosphate-sugar epimerase